MHVSKYSWGKVVAANHVDVVAWCNVTYEISIGHDLQQSFVWFKTVTRLFSCRRRDVRRSMSIENLVKFKFRRWPSITIELSCCLQHWSVMESRHLSRQKHLPRHRCQDTKRAKTLRIRLRQDEIETSFKCLRHETLPDTGSKTWDEPNHQRLD